MLSLLFCFLILCILLQCLSIVASEDIFDLEFPTTDARNIFALKLRQFIRMERTSGIDSVFSRSGSGMSSGSLGLRSSSGLQSSP